MANELPEEDKQNRNALVDTLIKRFQAMPADSMLTVSGGNVGTWLKQLNINPRISAGELVDVLKHIKTLPFPKAAAAGK